MWFSLDEHSPPSLRYYSTKKMIKDLLRAVFEFELVVCKVTPNQFYFAVIKARYLVYMESFLGVLTRDSW